MDDKEFTKVLGTIITDYRRECFPKISSREFADKCNLSKSLINSLENHTHNGNICNTTLNKIAMGLGLSEAMELREVIRNYSKQKINQKPSEDIIISKGSSLFDLLNTIKDFDDDSIKMLHSIAVKFKK